MIPLKIGFVIGGFGIGGAERQVLSLARGLDKTHIMPFLIGIKRDGALLSELAGSDSISTWSPEAAAGIDWSAIRRMAKYFDDNDIKIVLATNQYPTIFVRLALMMCDKPPLMICAFHSSPELFGDGFKDRLRMWAFRWAIGKARRLIFVSHKQREAWESIGLLRNCESEVIHNGVDIDAIRGKPAVADRGSLGWSDSDFVVGLCAQMRPEKRIPDLLMAAKQLCGTRVPIRVLLIGDGVERKKIDDFIARELPAGIVHITGLQSNVVPWIRMCDVVALVSKTEAFSMVSLEAMACEKPLVLSNVGGATEQVVHGVTGYTFECGEISRLSEVLGEIYSAGTAEAMGARGFEKVNNEFSVTTMMKRYLDTFQAVGRAN